MKTKTTYANKVIAIVSGVCLATGIIVYSVRLKQTVDHHMRVTTDLAKVIEKKIEENSSLSSLLVTPTPKGVVIYGSIASTNTAYELQNEVVSMNPPVSVSAWLYIGDIVDPQQLKLKLSKERMVEIHWKVLPPESENDHTASTK